jgi:hypothetical protein
VISKESKPKPLIRSGASGTKVFVLALLIALGLAVAYSYLLCTFIFPTLSNPAKQALTEANLKLALAAVVGFRALCHFTKWQFTLGRVMLVITVAAVGLSTWIYLRNPTAAETYAVTGQLLGPNGPQPIIGAHVYFFPTEYANKAEYLANLYPSEWGAIGNDKTISEWNRCSKEFDSIIKQNIGLAGPLDARFYPIKKLWFEMKASPKFLAFDSQMKEDLQAEFWEQNVATDPEFAKLTPSQLERYKSIILLGDESNEKLREKLETLPYVLSDSRGEFASRLPKGRHLLVARGVDSAFGVNYLWAVPFTVDRDTRFVTDDVICEAYPEK